MEDVRKQGVESLFCPYEQALELKELGFDETCFGSIDQIGYIHVKGSKSSPRGSMMYNTIDCPTFSQAFRFFREMHMLSGEIYIFKNIWNFDIEDIYNSIQLYTSDINSYSTYEEAEHECLVKLIDIAKEKNVK